jgi:hypothetical protein
MNRIKHGQINKWFPAKAGEIFEFVANKPRHVKFEVTTNSNIEIWVATNKKMQDAILVGTSDAKTEVQYTANETTYCQIKAQKGSAVFVNLPDLDQTRVQPDEAVYTNIEPRINQSTEFDRMMQYMKHNEAIRNQELEAERAQLREAIRNLETAPTPEPIVEAETEDAGETTT